MDPLILSGRQRTKYPITLQACLRRAPRSFRQLQERCGHHALGERRRQRQHRGRRVALFPQIFVPESAVMLLVPQHRGSHNQRACFCSSSAMSSSATIRVDGPLTLPASSSPHGSRPWFLSLPRTLSHFCHGHLSSLHFVSSGFHLFSKMEYGGLYCAFENRVYLYQANLGVS
jgi:hypothetical protein